jgi:hypothetical protein
LPHFIEGAPRRGAIGSTQRGEGGKMPRFHITWEMNMLDNPKTPEERAKLWLTLLEMVKADLKAGFLKDWGMAAGGLKGYGVWDGVSEAELFLNLLKWTTYVSFKVAPVLTVDQTIESIRKAVAAAQTR